MRLTFFYFLILPFFSCQKEPSPSVSFYYWKTTFVLNDYELKCLKENHVKRLYVRYFDIDLDKGSNEAFPVGTINFLQQPHGVEVVPVVYIKNKVMLNKGVDLDTLAQHVTNYIAKINKKQGINSNEIQLDCDWSENSRDRFMKFIEILKLKSNKKLSATIRLHQVKYFLKTKVPPVDYGVLMYYNMGTIAADKLNSVYDRKIAAKYLKSLKVYPMKLEVALPIFSRGVQIRDNKVVNLISKINIHSFEKDTNFIQTGENFVKTKNPNFKFGYYFKKNDKIKLETINFKDIIEMADDLGKNLKEVPSQIIFFDLDSINLSNNKNEKQDFKKIVNYF